MHKKHPYKAILFLFLLWLFDVLFRAGLIGHLFSIPIQGKMGGLIMYTLFAGMAWGATRLFCRWDQIRFADLGISLGRNNRREFWFGLLVGIIFWAIISYFQGLISGFSWTIQEDILIPNLLFGLLFIFVADLGTELFMRGYPMIRFREAYGPPVAIFLLSLFVGLKSLSPNLSGELLGYAILIPVLHNVFFSIIYLRTKRLGGSLGVHIGANFVSICIFDLDGEQAGELIPHGFIQPDRAIEELSMHTLQLPYVIGAVIFSVLVFYFWPTSLSSKMKQKA